MPSKGWDIWLVGKMAVKLDKIAIDASHHFGVLNNSMLKFLLKFCFFKIFFEHLRIFIFEIANRNQLLAYFTRVLSLELFSFQKWQTLIWFRRLCDIYLIISTPQFLPIRIWFSLSLTAFNENSLFISVNLIPNITHDFTFEFALQ